MMHRECKTEADISAFLWAAMRAAGFSAHLEMLVINLDRSKHSEDDVCFDRLDVAACHPATGKPLFAVEVKFWERQRKRADKVLSAKRQAASYRRRLQIPVFLVCGPFEATAFIRKTIPRLAKKHGLRISPHYYGVSPAA